MNCFEDVSEYGVAFLIFAERKRPFCSHCGCKNHLLTSDDKLLFASFWKTSGRMVLLNFLKTRLGGFLRGRWRGFKGVIF